MTDEEREAQYRNAVADVVRRQSELGLSVISDGEMSKPGFATYVPERLTGFSGTSPYPPMGDLADFPEYAADLQRRRGASMRFPACEGPVHYRGKDAVQRDIDNLIAALDGRSDSTAFMPAVAPGTVVQNFNNRHYDSDQEYLEAVAGAMAQEYRAIADAGLTLQVDAPDLAMSRHIHYRDASIDEFRQVMRLRIEALNRALAGIPPARVRVHVCWGNYPGPHHLDVPLREILAELLQLNAATLYLEAANPRHEHEWTVFQDVSLPEDKMLIVGCVDSLSTHVEHPELVAQRIRRYADLIGPERVTAGTDCGFGTFAGAGTVHPSVAWAKLAALVEGARLASRA